jgi:hypothetical protein
MMSVGVYYLMPRVMSYLFDRNEYAVFKEIKTQTITMEREKDGQAKKAKLFIRLEKADNFEENYKKFEEIKEANQKNKAAKETKQ